MAYPSVSDHTSMRRSLLTRDVRGKAVFLPSFYPAGEQGDRALKREVTAEYLSENGPIELEVQGRVGGYVKPLHRNSDLAVR